MTTRTWIGGTDNWTTAADWSPQGVPGVGDEAVIGAGGDVAITSDVFTGSIMLRGAGAVLDLSGAGGGIPVTNPIIFDDDAGKLVLTDGEAAQVQGFRAGDTVDIKGVSVTGALAPDSYGFIEIGAADFGVIGPTIPGATYTAASDGSGGTLIATTAEPAAMVALKDVTTGAAGSPALSAATSAPSYLQWQYSDAGDTDTVAIKASVPNVFLKGGSGIKALSVASGQNVLDGGSGSAFLSGGSGTDTFFVDIRSGSAMWDTIANFHAGDSVTVWGWEPGISTESVLPQAGAADYQGATLSLSQFLLTSPPSEVTFAGLSAAQVAHLQTSTGTVGRQPYLYLYNPGV